MRVKVVVRGWGVGGGGGAAEVAVKMWKLSSATPHRTKNSRGVSAGDGRNPRRWRCGGRWGLKGRG